MVGIRNHTRLADHGRSDVVDGDAVTGELQCQILRHAHESGFARGVMTPVDSTAVACDGAHENDTAPALGLHVRHAELAEQEGRAEVRLDGEIPLLDGDVEDVRDPLAVARVADQDVWPRLAVLLADLFEDAVDVCVLGHVDLVRGDADITLTAQRADELINRGLGGRVSEGKMDPLGVEVAGTGSP